MNLFHPSIDKTAKVATAVVVFLLAIAPLIRPAVDALATECAQEDSTNCYWDAESRGNGVGSSWLAVDVDDDGSDELFVRWSR